MSHLQSTPIIAAVFNAYILLGLTLSHTLATCPLPSGAQWPQYSPPPSGAQGVQGKCIRVLQNPYAAYTQYSLDVN